MSRKDSPHRPSAVQAKASRPSGVSSDPIATSTLSSYQSAGAGRSRESDMALARRDPGRYGAPKPRRPPGASELVIESRVTAPRDL
ncbi:hypothetical protein GCM10010151_49850 [Actinoallomurus spadix]|uniref:Uncharacterized protein n=1 Tax=Actinoallomurus spadix TaxID=79912 RepID=A0ABP3GTW6_9ACTN